MRENVLYIGTHKRCSLLHLEGANQYLSVGITLEKTCETLRRFDYVQ